MRVAIIVRPGSTPAPMADVPMLFAGLAKWVETYSTRFETLEFFVAGGGLAIGEFADAAELQGVLATLPFIPYSDVEIMPVVDPATSLATFGAAFEAMAAAG